MSHFIDSNNFEIAYYYESEDKNKPLVLFLHGFSDTYKTFAHIYQIDSQNRNFRFAGFDFPGCGSSSSKDDIMLEQYKQTTNDFLKQVLTEEKNIIVVSHSLGAYSALSVNENSKIKKTLLIAPINEFLNDQDNARNLNFWLLPNNIEECIQSYINLFSEITEKTKSVANWFCQKRASSFKYYQKRFKRMVNEQITNKSFLQNTIAKLYQNASNVNILSGQNDNYVSPLGIEKVSQKYNIKANIIPQKGHAFIFESKEIVFEELQRMVSEIK
ncbi:alpha/beta hydrolase [Mycoplasmopsis sturni]|uniref:alpha/beta hydrolase n=1 Tax=Mycoplasmopsis sturni TaxID=39047 RepID=UPI00055CB0E4|nr:alpha/beta hydrolase [Mycoplasmopsis sturni]